MHRRSLFFIFALVLLALIDLYAYKGIRSVSAEWGPVWRHGIRWAYWLTTLFIWTGFIIVALYAGEAQRAGNFRFFHLIVGMWFLFFVPKVVFSLFHFVDDLTWVASWAKLKMFPPPVDAEGEIVSRARFITQIGLAVSAVPFLSIGYGILKGRFNYTVMREKIAFPNLPARFDGIKIVQISDLHLGSFSMNFEAVQKGVDIINELKPDLILFTGDMVNNVAEETDGWTDVLAQLKAPLGKFSILGNHDYGDYIGWPTPEEKEANLDKLKQVQADMGFRLLLDEHIDLGDGFGLLGIQNWGGGNMHFAKYGDLQKTMNGADKYDFRLLLSHDPTHWDEQVLDKEPIDLTLSGHTHGAQMGVKILSKEYSPAQMIYDRWAGLYQEGKQYLYVNRGFGFIGFPGRVGMPPEITLLELNKA